MTVQRYDMLEGHVSEDGSYVEAVDYDDVLEQLAQAKQTIADLERKIAWLDQ